MSRTLSTLALIALLAPASAPAEGITLDRPMAGASFEERGVAMSVYYVEADAEGYEVVATYADTARPAEPSRLKMRLADGDAVSFSLPGHTQTLYSFAREGRTVRVTGEPADARLALAE